MGAGHQFEINAMKEEKKDLHPAWSAVGCFTLVGLIALGYFVGDWFVKANGAAGWLAFPREWAWPAENPFLIIKISVTLLVLLIGSAVFSIVYTLINPPKPGKFDITDSTIFPPPPKRRR